MIQFHLPHKMQILQKMPNPKHKMDKFKINNCIANAIQQMINSHLKITDFKDMFPRCIPANINIHLPNTLNIHKNIMCLHHLLIILLLRFKINLLVKLLNRTSKMTIKVPKCCHFQKFRFQKSLRSLRIYLSLAMMLIKNGKTLDNQESCNSLRIN